MTTTFRAPEAAPRRTTLSNDPLDDAIAVQRLQGFLGCDAADTEELRKLHLGRHAIPHAQPARPDLVQDVVVEPLVQERPVVVLDAHDEGDTLGMTKATPWYREHAIYTNTQTRRIHTSPNGVLALTG